MAHLFLRATFARTTVGLAAAMALVAGCSDDTQNQGGSNDTGGGSTSSSPTTGGSGNDGGSGQGGAPDGGSGEGGSGEPMGAGLPGGPSSQRLTEKPLGTVEGATQGYYEYLPPHYGNGAKYPLLMFYHGIGENGDGVGELSKVLNTGLPALLKNDQWPESQPFVILSTQHPGGGCHSDAEISGMLAFAMASYDIDPKRVYITGLSCGAIGGWGYLGNHTNEVVAAAVLIAGDGNGAFAQAGCDLGSVPIWALHGDADGTVNVSGSINPIENLNDCTDPAPVEAKITIYPGVGHNSWDMTYDPEGPNDIYSWMLGYVHP